MQKNKENKYKETDMEEIVLREDYKENGELERDKENTDK